MSGDSDVDRYEAFMEIHNITAALVVGYEGEGIDPDNNAYLRSLATERPWMSTVAHLPVSPPPTLDHLEKLLTAGHSGIALHCPDAARRRRRLARSQLGTLGRPRRAGLVQRNTPGTFWPH